MRATLERDSIIAGLLVPAVAAAQAVRPENGTRLADSSHSIQAQLGISSALAAVLIRSCGDPAGPLTHGGTMQTATLEQRIADFLAQKRIAVAGVIMLPTGWLVLSWTAW